MDNTRFNRLIVVLVIIVSWNAVTRYTSGQPIQTTVRYKVFRATKPNLTDGQMIVDTNVLTYADDPPVQGGFYYYYIQSYTVETGEISTSSNSYVVKVKAQ